MEGKVRLWTNRQGVQIARWKYSGVYYDMGLVVPQATNQRSVLVAVSAPPPRVVTEPPFSASKLGLSPSCTSPWTFLPEEGGTRDILFFPSEMEDTSEWTTGVTEIDAIDYTQAVGRASRVEHLKESHTVCKSREYSCGLEGRSKGWEDADFGPGGLEFL